MGDIERNDERGRYVVVLDRLAFDVPEELRLSYDGVVIGTYRSRERAEKRAATIRRLAETYEDPEGVTGPDNALDVRVVPLRRGATSAQDALDALYGVTE